METCEDVGRHLENPTETLVRPPQVQALAFAKGNSVRIGPTGDLFIRDLANYANTCLDIEEMLW